MNAREGFFSLPCVPSAFQEQNMTMAHHMAANRVQAALLRKCPECGEMKKTALSEINTNITCPKCGATIPPKKAK